MAIEDKLPPVTEENISAVSKRIERNPSYTTDLFNRLNDPENPEIANFLKHYSETAKSAVMVMYAWIQRSLTTKSIPMPKVDKKTASDVLLETQINDDYSNMMLEKIKANNTPLLHYFLSLAERTSDYLGTVWAGFVVYDMLEKQLQKREEKPVEPKPVRKFAPWEFN